MRQRGDAELGGLGVAHDHEGGGAVVERARDLPAVTWPSGRNTGFSSASFSLVVPARGLSSFDTTVPSGRVIG